MYRQQRERDTSEASPPRDREQFYRKTRIIEWKDNDREVVLPISSDFWDDLIPLRIHVDSKVGEIGHCLDGLVQSPRKNLHRLWMSIRQQCRVTEREHL